MSPQPAEMDTIQGGGTSQGSKVQDVPANGKGRPLGGRRGAKRLKLGVNQRVLGHGRRDRGRWSRSSGTAAGDGERPTPHRPHNEPFVPGTVTQKSCFATCRRRWKRLRVPRFAPVPQQHPERPGGTGDGRGVGLILPWQGQMDHSTAGITFRAVMPEPVSRYLCAKRAGRATAGMGNSGHHVTPKRHRLGVFPRHLFFGAFPVRVSPALGSTLFAAAPVSLVPKSGAGSRRPRPARHRLFLLRRKPQERSAGSGEPETGTPASRGGDGPPVTP